jgi:hypothetical protein
VLGLGETVFFASRSKRSPPSRCVSHVTFVEPEPTSISLYTFPPTVIFNVSCPVRATAIS